ncbi:hypothetical protein FHY56_12135 [Brucella gallinifaecis]|uniref:Uncharacterized protein n=1 Tax=Brucella gallinifaecis TaxID=215590 RepID=A0A502BJU7_9HYPH|nr:hypothetical protein FHY56_12135 [Brucella gallinifaecis]
MKFSKGANTLFIAFSNTKPLRTFAENALSNALFTRIDTNARKLRCKSCPLRRIFNAIPRSLTGRQAEGQIRGA